MENINSTDGIVFGSSEKMVEVAKTVQFEHIDELVTTLTEKIEEEQTPDPNPNTQPPQPKGAPLENPRSSNFDLFAGTSWEGKKQGF